MTIEQRIEDFLKTASGNGWVKGKDLCRLFDLPSDRVLRKIGDEPGYCTEIAISGNKGFKHIDRASPGEWDEYYRRERAHTISSYLTLRRKRYRRSNVVKTIKKPALILEKDTGQSLMFDLPVQRPY